MKEESRRMQRMLNDVYMRLDDNFTLTSEQAVWFSLFPFNLLLKLMIQTTVRIVTQDTISRPACVCFMSMYNEVLVSTGLMSNSKSDETRKSCS